MSTDPRRRSPLAHRQPIGTADTLHLSELPFWGLLSVRGDPVAVGPAVREVLGIDLPGAVKATAGAGGVTALWQSPDEWLLVTEPGREGEVQARLTDALAGRHHQLVDLSDYDTIVTVAGPAARAALAKLIALDLHPRALAAGQAVSTLLAKATVRLWLVQDGEVGPAFRLIVRRSHADYVWCLLADAGRQWGLPPQEPIGRVPLDIGA